MRKIILIIILAIFWPVAGAVADERTGTLKGRIEDEKGKPIAGAEVRVVRSRDRSARETRTDQAGEYVLELEADDYIVSFDAEGFQGGTLVQMHQVEPGKETVIKAIRLRKGKPSSLVRGVVFDIDGLSLAGARIKLVRVPTEEEKRDGKKIESLSRDYTANRRGEFAFRLPSARARYALTATLKGFKPQTRVVEVNEEESVPVAFSLEPRDK